MSYNQRNLNQNKKNTATATATATVTKKFCKVCFDSGKTEAQYTSHFVKAEDRKTVICPTLLDQECRVCFNTGHTPSCCPVLKERNSQNRRYQEQSQREQAQEKKEQKKQPKKFANIYEAFNDDECSNNQQQVAVKEEFPQLPCSSTPAEKKAPAKATASAFSYSAAASAPKPIKREEFVPGPLVPLNFRILELKPKTYSMPIQIHRRSHSWADESSDDDDDDNDYYGDYTDSTTVEANYSSTAW